MAISLPRVRVRGLDYVDLDPDALRLHLATSLRTRRSLAVFTPNAHIAASCLAKPAHMALLRQGDVLLPDGIGVVPWMVPGGRDIAVATSELMKKYDVAIWAHHGMFCSGEDFDLTFGLMHTVEKSAEILVKVLSMQSYKRQTILPDDFRHLAVDFNVTLPEKFLYEKN